MGRGRSPKSLASQRRGLSAGQILAERAALLAALTRVRAEAREIRTRLAALTILAAQQARRGVRPKAAAPPIALPECATITDVARRVSLSPWTLRSWCRARKLPFFKVGKRIVLRVRDVEQLLEESYQPALTNGLPSPPPASRAGHPAPRPASTNGPHPPDGGA
jgi:Helix-turn-helix domain